MTGKTPQQKWTDIWGLFEPDEKLQACQCYVKYVAADKDWQSHPLFSRLADATKFRLGEVTRLARQNPAKLAAMLRPRVASVLNETIWANFFSAYYFEHKAALMCEFLDQLGIAHDGRGEIKGEFESPTAEAIAKAVQHLLKTYSTREVCRYLCVLARRSDQWDGAVPDRDRLLESAFEATHKTERLLTEADAKAVADSSGDFSVLDRLIVREVVRTVATVEGSLDEESLQDLVETVLRLNDQWYRAYFHLGFMDVLVPSRSLQFDRPEDNDQRRGWYFAGVVAGLARSHAMERATELIASYRKDFERCASRPGGSGAALAHVGFRFLLEAGLLDEALLVLRSQIDKLGLPLGREALAAATEFIREGRYESAKAIVDVLGKHEVKAQDEDDVERYRLDIERRRGQCLQAAGDFDNAERAFRRLLEAGEDKSSPDLLADLGLVKGKFRRVDDLKLPEHADRRMNVRDALTKAEPFFQKAVETFGSNSPKAAYALAVLCYLRWTFEPQAEARRVSAVAQVRAAISAIRESQFEAVYRDIGALGQCQFMLVVLLMKGLDAVESRDGAAVWESITEKAGKFPVSDLRTLLEAAEIHDSALALEIAESICDFQREEALQVLSLGWIPRSQKLRKEILEIVRNPATPRARRMHLWTSIIPTLIRSNEIRAAEEGLEQLEELSDEPELAKHALVFLERQESFDPAWSGAEASWVRVRLLRRLGMDSDCAHELRRLFFAVRDSDVEARQIVETFVEWRLDADMLAELSALLPQTAELVDSGVEARLRSGEVLSLMFVGGNETQVQYDSAIRVEFAKEWPGVTLRFEHSGWSSNWGRDVDRLLAHANGSDAVVLHRMMRTMLGRALRAGLSKPWIPCSGTGRGAILRSLRRAAIVGLEQRLRRSTGSLPIAARGAT